MDKLSLKFVKRYHNRYDKHFRQIRAFTVFIIDYFVKLNLLQKILPAWVIKQTGVPLNCYLKIFPHGHFYPVKCTLLA